SHKLLLHILQSRDQLLHQLLFRIGPQDAARNSGIRFDGRSKRDKLLNIGFYALLAKLIEIQLFVQKWSVESEIDLDVSVLLEDSVFEVCSMNQEFHRLRLESPGSIESTANLRTPQVPHRFKLIRMIAVHMLACDFDGLLRSGARIERLLEDQRLIPRDGMYAQISNARLRAGKWELLEDSQDARHHLRFVEAGKPKAEIKTVCHRVSSFYPLIAKRP